MMDSHLRFRYQDNLKDSPASAEDLGASDVGPTIEEVLTTIAYYEHLVRRVGRHDTPVPPLIAYFGEGSLFHDAAISRIKLSPNGKTLTLEMHSCAIDNAQSQRTDAGVLVSFTFRFHDVVWFANELRHNFKEEWISDRGTYLPRVFLYSEVDSLDELLEAATTRYAHVPNSLGDVDGVTDFHSLLIQHCQPNGMVGVVFRRMEVWPAEPLAWYMLCRDPTYINPLLTLERLLLTLDRLREWIDRKSGASEE